MANRISAAMRVFERALDESPAERERLLRLECAGDDDLLRQVRAMLDADARPELVLDHSPDALAATLAPLVRPGLEGRRVGPYRILSELGRGGMGVVYLAVREDVGLQVALKLIASSLASAERVARFHYERRMLASLEHPNIARFLDAGVADDETPWFAMEYVSGSPIDAYCDTHRLSVADRLALFEKVGEAVAYAHRNLLVHRDLKPSNVLVSEAGEPKLVDFGIAKLLAGDGETQPTLTDANRRAMTPAYASPEQLRGEPLTTASDVYQLGILLHELLTGRLPSRPRGEPLDQMGRVAGLEPARPSTMVSRPVTSSGDRQPIGPTAAELSKLRRVSPDRLRRQLEGDLDNIVQMAMRPEPDRRYPSAQQLVDDVHRHRDGRPVDARPGSLSYRLGKLMIRHKAAAAIAAAFVVFLGVAAVMFAGQAQRVSRERDRALLMSRTLEDLVRYADPTAVVRDSLAPRPVLEQAAAQARLGIREEPEAWGRMLVTVGTVYRNLGLADTAKTIFAEAVAALEPVAAPGDGALLDAISGLGVLQIEEGDFENGISQLERAASRARRFSTDRKEQLAESLIDLGYGRQVAGDEARAHTLYREALSLLETLPDSGGPDYNRVSINMGYIARSRGNHTEAERLFRRTVERRVASYGPTHSRTLNAKAALARALLRLDGLAEADRLSAELLATRTVTFKDPHPLLAEAYELRARVLAEQGELATADSLGREAMAMYRELLGDRHMLLAYTMAMVSGIATRQERHVVAAELLRDAIAQYRSIVGEDHRATLATLSLLAQAEKQLGNLATAELMFRQAITGIESLGHERGTLVAPLTRYGVMLAESGRCSDARPHLERAIALADARPAVVYETLGDASRWLASCSS